MTEMILNFIEMSIYVVIYFTILTLSFYGVTAFRKSCITKQCTNKGIKLKCVRWKPFSHSFFSATRKKVYLVEYIKKDGRVAKAWLKSKFIF